MKDNFSAQAQGYAQFRPHYPPEMIAYIASLAKNRHAALDVATGNGQVAAALAHSFDAVHAIDISSKQLQNATQLPNIYYSEQPAEATNFADATFDLITVAQAIHWFNFGAFYKEVYRLLKPEGILAVIGYGLFTTNPETDRIIRHFYNGIVGPYWDAERRYLDENYTTIPFPFEEAAVPQFSNVLTWTFEQLTGYLETWSATQHYITANGTNPVDVIREDLRASWEKNNKRVVFPLLLRIGKAYNRL
ncbi:MAG: class I SAM-dependent methyltransferase [Bacteroidota bacterium]